MLRHYLFYKLHIYTTEWEYTFFPVDLVIVVSLTLEFSF